MIWPSPETATVPIFAGTLDLPQRSPNVADAIASDGGQKCPPFAITGIRGADPCSHAADLLSVRSATLEPHENRQSG
jgi:hypothetical protein